MRYLCFADSYVRVVEGARPLSKSSLANASSLGTSNPTSELIPGPPTGGGGVCKSGSNWPVERERESRIGYS